MAEPRREKLKGENHMTVFYFTGTGNSLAVTKRIGGTLISIPQVIDSDNPHYMDDVIGVVFPVYWATAPDMVLKFIETAKFECEYLFLLATHGGGAAASLKTVQRLAGRNGYQFSYLDDIGMIDNSMSSASIEAQIAKQSKEKFESKMAVILKNIASRKQNHDKNTSIFWGAFTFVVSKIPNYEKFPQKYLIDDKCNLCKTCSKVCPAGNVEVNDKVNFSKLCTGCLACLHNCPENAIHLKRERSAARWRHPEVTLKEIIDANNRTDFR